MSAKYNTSAGKVEDANTQVIGAEQGTQELTGFVQNLLQNMQERFQEMSDSIISRIDEMGSRIDELEKSITELVQQAGVDEADIQAASSGNKSKKKS